MKLHQKSLSGYVAVATGLLAAGAAWGAPDFTVVFSSCPEPGPIEVSWSGATPGGTVAILWSNNDQAIFVIPSRQACAGTRTGLGRGGIQAVHIGPSGRTGSDGLVRYAGPNACHGFMQLIDLTTCEVSNVEPFAP